jgi:hypothetical protein
MRHFIVPRWFTHFYSSRQIGVALLGGALAALPLVSANAQEAFQQPDYSKFPAESGPITLEVWSWVGGLDKAAKLFEQRARANGRFSGASGMPLMQTGLVTVALLCFVGAWNNFFFPLIVLSQDSLYPLTLGLNVWNSVSSAAGGRPVYNLIALGSLISVLPQPASLTNLKDL